MQVKMSDILGFSSFYETVRNQKLTFKTAYRLTRLSKAIEQELQFYREKLQAIIQEYAQLDDDNRPIPTEDGDGIKLRAGSEEQCYAAMNELQDLEIELPDVTFTVDDFANVELTTTEMGAILPFFVE